MQSSTEPTSSDLRLALARLVVRHYWHPFCPYGGSRNDELQNAAYLEQDLEIRREVDAIAPLFVGILSRDEIIEKVMVPSSASALELVHASLQTILEAA